MRNQLAKRLLSIAVSSLLTATVAFAGEETSPAFAPPHNFAWNASDTHTGKPDLASFWKRFDDAKLTELVERALRENHDLRIALARFDSANALLRATKFDRLPTITAQADAS